MRRVDLSCDRYAGKRSPIVGESFHQETLVLLDGVASRAADASTSARRYRPAMRVLMKFGLAGLCTAHLAGERPDAPNIELSDPQNRRPTIVDLIETSRDWSAWVLQRMSMVEMLMGGRDTYQEVPFTGTSPTKTGWAASAVIR